MAKENYGKLEESKLCIVFTSQRSSYSLRLGLKIIYNTPKIIFLFVT